MKKMASLLLCLLMVFTLGTAMAEEVLTVKPGDELSMDVSISGAGGFSAKISIDTGDAPVTFKSAVGGTANDTVPPKAFNDFFVVVNLDGVDIKPDGSNFTGNLTDYDVINLVDGKIGTLTFTVDADAAPGTYTVAAKKESGSVTVEGSVTFTIEAASSRLPGDVNDDGEVDMFDTTLLDMYLADWDVTINLVNADVNADGEVDMFDSTLLDMYLADWDVTLK